MGGINHQPCNSYLEPSTNLSRSTTAALAAFLSANVVLEDVILQELRGDQGALAPSVDQLDRSLALLFSAREDFANLRRLMDKLGFADLPSLDTVNLDTLGEELSSLEAIEESSWSSVAHTMRDGGFRASLDKLEANNEHLVVLTEELRDAMAALVEFGNRGEVALVLEENLSGNIKLPFARLFCLWSLHMQEFLASSMISTELWYAHKGFGSMLPEVSVPICQTA